MTASVLLALAFLQAPGPSNVLSPAAPLGEASILLIQTEPVLAPRSPVSAVSHLPVSTAPITLRLSTTDVWGCVYGSPYYCRHASAVTEGSIPFLGVQGLQGELDPCPSSGPCAPAYYISGSSLYGGQIVAREWRWGPSEEFVSTNRGLAAGKVIMESRAREAAARQSEHQVRQAMPPGQVGGGAYSGSSRSVQAFGGGAASAPVPSSSPARTPPGGQL